MKVMEIKIRGGKSLKFDESSAFPVAFSIVLPCGCCSQAWEHSVREGQTNYAQEIYTTTVES